MVMDSCSASHGVTELLKHHLLPENLGWLLFLQGFLFSSLV